MEAGFPREMEKWCQFIVPLQQHATWFFREIFQSIRDELLNLPQQLFGETGNEITKSCGNFLRKKHYSLCSDQ